MTKKAGDVDFNITDLSPEKTGAYTGITWRSVGRGIVPIYEEHYVRVLRGLTIDEWYALDPMERALHVAVDRIERSIKAHQSSADAVEMERKSKGMKK